MAMARLSPTATRIWGITAALGLVTTAAIFGLAQPVNAHNSLVVSTPAEGETLTSLPESFSVTTSDTLLAGGVAVVLWGLVAWQTGERALDSITGHEVSTVSFALPVFWGYLIVAIGSATMATVSLLHMLMPEPERSDDDAALDEGV